MQRATVDEVAALYKKVGFLIWRRLDGEPDERHERLRNIVCQWLASSTHGKQKGSPIAGVYRLAFGAPITEKPPADDANILPTGRSVDDLKIERFLLGDLPSEQHQRVGGTITESSEDCGRMDSLLKQRLIFLADNRPDTFAQNVVEQLARDAGTPPPRRQRSWRWFAVPAATTATICLTTVAVWTRAGSSPMTQMKEVVPTSAHETKFETTVVPEITDEVIAQPDPDPTDDKTDQPDPDPLTQPAPPAPRPKRKTRPSIASSAARFIVYARSTDEARLLEDGDTLAADEKIVAWIKTEEPGFAAVIGRRGKHRARIHFSDDRESIAVPAGGPTRLGNAKQLRPVENTTNETLCLLYAAEPFSVRPIAQQLRTGVDLDEAFDGVSRCITVETPTATP